MRLSRYGVPYGVPDFSGDVRDGTANRGPQLAQQRLPVFRDQLT